LGGGPPPRNVDGLGSTVVFEYRTFAEFVVIVALNGNLFLVLRLLGISTPVGRCTWGLGGQRVAGVRSEKSLKLCLRLEFVLFRP
jgi:hypothetical protein